MQVHLSYFLYFGPLISHGGHKGHDTIAAVSYYDPLSDLGVK